MSDNVLSAEYVRQCFSYNADTGDLIWRQRPLEHFKTKRGCGVFNAMFCGKAAGSEQNGYIRSKIDGRLYANHRIIWLMVNGVLTKDEIDHINHDRADNRLCNLRNVSRSENQKNRSKRKDNTSGVTGVFLRKDSSKWQVLLGCSNKLNNFGCFDNFDDAVIAVENAKQTHGFHENHGK